MSIWPFGDSVSIVLRGGAEARFSALSWSLAGYSRLKLLVALSLEEVMFCIELTTMVHARGVHQAHQVVVPYYIDPTRQCPIS